MSDVVAMRPVNYRGGLVRFAIPGHWTEEYEPEGGGTFYDPAVEAVTFRLNVLTFKSDHPLRRSESAAVFARRATQEGVSVEPTIDDQALLISRPKRIDENGEALELHSWQLGRVVEPDTIHIAVFATTVIAEEPANDATRTTLTLLLAEVRRAVVTNIAGPVA